MLQAAPALTVVALVLRLRPEVLCLEHVIREISSYVDGSVMIPLARACSLGSLRLLERIWANSEHNSYWTADRNTSWSLCRFLRTDIHYHRYQFTKSLRAASTRGDVDMMCWILEHFLNCTAGVEVVKEAARCGQLEILELLLDYGSQQTQGQERNTIVWGGDDMEAAIQAGHGDIACWLLQNAPNAERDLSRVMKFAVRLGNLPLIQWLLTEVYRPEVHLPPPSMNDAAIGGHGEILQWIFGQGYHEDSDHALKGAAKNGRLDMVQWLVEKGVTTGAEEAVQEVCSGGHLSIVQWLLERNLGQYAYFAMYSAINNGHLHVVKYLYERGIADSPSSMMINAAAYGHLDVVKYLYQLFGDTPDDIFPAFDPSQDNGGISNRTAMDRAAISGHLHMLEYLQSLAAAIQRDKKKKGSNVFRMGLCSSGSRGSHSHHEVALPQLSLPMSFAFCDEYGG